MTGRDLRPIQPGRPAHCHRFRRQHRAGVGRADRPAADRAVEAQQTVISAAIQPGRPARCHRFIGQHRAGVGRADRPATDRALETRRLGGLRPIQPGRPAHCHRVLGQHRAGLGCADRPAADPTLEARRAGGLRPIQPGWPARGHRFSRRHRAGVGRADRPAPDRTLETRGLCALRPIQPGWPARGHRLPGQHRAGVGRTDRPAPDRTLETRKVGEFRPIQPGRPARGHRFRRQHRAGVGCADRPALDRTFKTWSELFTARFSPDGRRVVTASRDHTARVWDVGLAPSRCPDWLLPLAEALWLATGSTNKASWNRPAWTAPKPSLKYGSISRINRTTGMGLCGAAGCWRTVPPAPSPPSPASRFPPISRIESKRAPPSRWRKRGQLASGNAELSQRVVALRASFEQTKRLAVLESKARALASLGELAEAEASYREALRLSQELWTNQPAKWEISVKGLADVLKRQGKSAGAE